jgi:hypothetical protein
MRHRSHIPEKERRSRSRLAKLIVERPWVKGGLVAMSRTCGKAGCRCRRGEKHVSLYLSTKVVGKAKMVFVPAALEKQVRVWVQTYKDAAAILESLSGAQVEKLLALKAEARPRKKAADR